jgi:carboxyl-terminal processing protease
MINNSQKLNRVGYVLLVIAAYFIGATVNNNKISNNIINGSAFQQLNGSAKTLPKSIDSGLINEVWDIVQKKYVSTINEEKISEGIIGGLVAGLGDPFSAYANKQETKQFAEEISGKFSGIGVEIAIKNDLVTIVAPLKDSPAEKAGIKAGDFIISIDDKAIKQDESITEIANKIRGPINTEVKLKIIREKLDKAIDITIKRDNIELKSVTLDIKDGIGIISLSVFHEDTAGKFKQIVKQLTQARVKGIVLDMRNDPGGVLFGAVEIAGHFIKEGEIVVREIPRDPNKTVTHYSEGPGELSNIPTVVLLNGGSASASEILAGALRDIRGIKIIGEKSFGKGSVQEMINLSDGSSLRVTIAKWFMPKGGEIAEKGIAPDITITDEDSTDKIDVQLDKAIAVLQAEISNTR